MNEQAVFEQIVSNARAILPALAERPITPADSLRALGANSVDRSEIIMMTMEALQIDVPLIAMARAENIGDLVKIMCGPAHA